jgi:hypothetical protein
MQAPVDAFNRGGILNLTGTNPISSAVGFTVPGYFQFKGGPLYAVQHNNFGPRLSLAYRLTSRLVFRGGYALFFDPGEGHTGGSDGPVGNQLSTPWVSSLDGYTIQQVNGVYQTLSTAFPPIRVPPSNPRTYYGDSYNIGYSIDGFAKINHTPQVSQWMAGFDYEIQPNTTSIEIDYVGNHGTKLNSGGVPLNQVPESDLSLGTALLNPVPNPFYGVITGSSCGLNNPNIPAFHLSEEVRAANHRKDQETLEGH